MKQVLYKLLPWGIIILILLCWMQTCDKIDRLDSANKALNDSIHISRDEHGRLVSSTRVMEITNRELRKEISSKDESIIELQKVAEKYKKSLISATITNVHTNEHGQVGNNTVTGRDTVYRGNKIYIYPEYSKTITKPWGFSMSLKMNKDSTYYNIDTYNRMLIIQRLQRRQFFAFAKKSPFDYKDVVVDITTYNPNSGVEELKSYHVSQPKRYRGLQLLGSFAGGFITGWKARPH